jgi:hypothetical protein
MTNLSPEAQAVWDAFNDASLMNDVTERAGVFEDYGDVLAAALRVLIDKVVPEETEAPRAVFDCEPRPSYNFKTNKCDGPLRHDHSAHLRRQFRQEELDIRWEQRRQTRALMLVVVTELEAQ